MDLIEEKTYYDNIKDWNMNFNWIFCETKMGLNIILDLVEDIEKLTFFEFDNEDLLMKIYDKFDKISFENKKRILNITIRLGSWFSSYFANKSNLDTSTIPKKFFIEWIKDSWKNLIFDSNFDSFLGLYKNPEELYLTILEEWFIWEYYELTENKNIIVDEKILDVSLKNFKNNFQNYSYEVKKEILTNDLYVEIFNNISDNPKKHINLISDFLFFNENEKNILESNIVELHSILNRRIEEIKDKWIKQNELILVDEYDFDSFSLIDNYKSEIIRNITFLKKGDELLIDIINIFWKEDTISISNKKEWNFHNNFDYTCDEIKTLFSNIIDEYIFNFKNSNIEFTILLSKPKINGWWGWWKKQNLKLVA